MDEQVSQPQFPLLERLLFEKNLPLLGVYTNADVAKIFGVSVRTVSDWVRVGKLHSRTLPGRARFLSQDLEDFLRNSRRGGGDA